MKMLINKERTWLKEAHPGIITDLYLLPFPVLNFEESFLEEDLGRKQIIRALPG
ncbi:MAG: hypothetical protein HYW01_08165 [Deltaproteobacteria bacterium]|nr:hypothetical protein [Deltaproteobacteria bacterium]